MSDVADNRGPMRYGGPCSKCGRTPACAVLATTCKARQEKEMRGIRDAIKDIKRPAPTPNTDRRQATEIEASGETAETMEEIAAQWMDKWLEEKSRNRDLEAEVVRLRETLERIDTCDACAAITARALVEEPE